MQDKKLLMQFVRIFDQLNKSLAFSHLRTGPNSKSTKEKVTTASQNVSWLSIVFGKIGVPAAANWCLISFLETLCFQESKSKYIDSKELSIFECTVQNKMAPLTEEKDFENIFLRKICHIINSSIIFRYSYEPFMHHQMFSNISPSSVYPRMNGYVLKSPRPSNSQRKKIFDMLFIIPIFIKHWM